VTAVLVPIGHEIPGEDIYPAPFAPVPAAAHIASLRQDTPPSAEFGGPLKHDGWPPASDAEFNVQCSSDDCGYIGDMPVIGDDGQHVELRCPECGESTYERVED
jgi:hypothetical protein